MSYFRIDVSLVLDTIEKCIHEIAHQNEYLSEITKDFTFMDSAWEDAAQKLLIDKFMTTKNELEKLNAAFNNGLYSMKSFVENCVNRDKILSTELSKLHDYY